MPTTIAQRELIAKRRARVKNGYLDLLAKGKDATVAIMVLASRERVTENTIRNDLRATGV